MNLQQIKVFNAIVEEGQYTRAGEALGYTQSRVTQMMKAFEEETGFSCFIKTRNGAELTQSGKLILPYVKQILADLERFNSEIDDLNGLKKGSLKIGTHISCSIAWLPYVMSSFQIKYPDIETAIVEGGQQSIINDIKNHNVDFGIISRPDDESVDFIPLYEDPIVVAMPDDDQLSEYGRIPMSALDGCSFVISDSVFDSDSEKVLTNSDIDYNIEFTLRNDFAIMSMVRNGIGISIMPELVLKNFLPGDLTYRELEPSVSRTLGIGMISRDVLGPVGKTFIKELTGVVRRRMKE
ncbi:MAG: LysR family transcriptional regulator [Eubacterium sp.]